MRLQRLTTFWNMYCIPCFRRIQCSPRSPHLTLTHLNAGFDLNGKSIPSCYVVTISCMVTHKEGGQGGHCGHYMARYCHVLIFRFCWCQADENWKFPRVPPDPESQQYEVIHPKTSLNLQDMKKKQSSRLGRDSENTGLFLESYPTVFKCFASVLQ